jgi:hypothetical protein
LDNTTLLLFIPVLAIAASVSINAYNFTKESQYLKNKYRLKERERILTLWEAEMICPCEEPMQHLASHIKGENK